MNATALICEHCGNAYTLTPKQAKSYAGRFCSLPCAHAGKRGKPAPGFITPESDKRQRVAANGLVNKRLKLGWFEKPTRCMKCGEVKRLDSHHPDYSRPNEVLWLCRSDHMQLHHDPHHCDGIKVFVCDDRRTRGVA